MRKIFLLHMAFIICFILFSTTIGWTQPPPAITVWGMVTYDDGPVPLGHPVNVTVGTDDFTTSIFDDEGRYLQQFSQPEVGTMVSVSCTYQGQTGSNQTPYQNGTLMQLDIQIDVGYPVITTTPSSSQGFNIILTEGATTTQSLIIGNIGGGELVVYSITDAIAASRSKSNSKQVGSFSKTRSSSREDATWLYCELPTNFTVQPEEEHTVIVNFDASALTNGTYTANLTIESNDLENPTVVIPVTLIVESDSVPQITTIPSSNDGFNIILAEGASTTENLIIGNTGNGELIVYSINDAIVASRSKANSEQLYSISKNRSSSREGAVWLSCEPPINFSVQPGEGHTVVVNFDASALTSDIYTAILTIESNDPENPTVVIPVSLTVEGCVTPNWSVPGGFEQSMSVICYVAIDGIVESDPDNLVGAFVDGEIRGVNNYPFFQNNSGIWVAIVTIAGTEGENVSFQMFDASVCQLLDIDEELTFQNDGYGTPIEPFSFNVTSTVTQVIPLTAEGNGWNWFSINVIDDDMSLNSVLSSVGANGLQIKTNVESASYFGGDLGWMPNFNIDPKALYKIKMAAQDTLIFNGSPVDVEQTHVELGFNWNWIGFLPQEEMEINCALASLPDGTPVQLKTNNDSSWYLGGGQWSTMVMVPGKGYKIKMDDIATLIYPESCPQSRNNNHSQMELSLQRDNPVWYVPEGFEESMSVICQVFINLMPENDPENLIGAFVNDEVRGVNNSEFFDIGDGTYVAIVTVAGNLEEEISFKLYDNSTEEILSLDEVLIFQNDGDGSPSEPFEFGSVTSTIGKSTLQIPAKYALYGNYPNPFNPTTVIRYELPESDHVNLQIYDPAGRLVTDLVNENKSAGNYSVVWNGLDDSGKPVGSGVYFCRIRTNKFEDVHKMVLLR